MAATRSNATQHFAVETSTGDSFHEKCRDSLGGWSNMMDRVADRLGVHRSLGLRAVNADGTAWAAGDGPVAGWRTADGVVVTFTAVEVL